MINMTLKDAAHVVSGQLVAEESAVDRFKGVTIDSRKLQQGQLFAALPGENTDGHDYVARVLKQGAAVALVSHLLEGVGTQIVVKDVQLALGKLAAFWLAYLRERKELTVIAVTGSNGKTTVKEMLGSVLSLRHKVLMTRGNQNNELGLPLTLFELGSAHEYAVLELGASRPGDIAYLCEICNPDIALLNNVGPAHLQGFGDLHGVARAKGEIFAGLNSSGTAIVNADEPWQEGWQQQIAGSKTISFGSQPDSDVSAGKNTELFNLQTPQGHIAGLQLPLPGQHNRMNALAAVAVLQAVHIPLDEIRQGLENVPAVAGRLNTQLAVGGWKIIDDTYNANPASLYAGLSVLTNNLAAGEAAWLILGDMAELGDNSPRLHREMGEAASALGVHRLFAVGELSRHSVEGFGLNALHYENKTSLLADLFKLIHPGVISLVKGSRSMGMEDVALALLNYQPACNKTGQHRETV